MQSLKYLRINLWRTTHYNSSITSSDKLAYTKRMCVSSIERLCSQYKVLIRVLKNVVEPAGVVVKKTFRGMEYIGKWTIFGT